MESLPAINILPLISRFDMNKISPDLVGSGIYVVRKKSMLKKIKGKYGSLISYFSQSVVQKWKIEKQGFRFPN